MAKYISFRKNKLKKILITNLLRRKILKNKHRLRKHEKNSGKGESKTYNMNNICVQEHYFTFQQHIDLFTLIYSTLVFKWIQTDRVHIYYLLLGRNYCKRF
jgi:hypothetical protein